MNFKSQILLKVSQFESNLWFANFSQKLNKQICCLLFYSSRQTNQIRLLVFWENLLLANLLFGFIWPLMQAKIWFVWSLSALIQGLRTRGWVYVGSWQNLCSFASPSKTSPSCKTHEVCCPARNKVFQSRFDLMHFTTSWIILFFSSNNPTSLEK